MLIDVIEEAFSRVTYKPGMYFVAGPHDDMYYIQLHIDEIKDVDTGNIVNFAGGYAFIQNGSKVEDVVREMFKLCKAWEEHELYEFFQVDGIKIFDPHKPMIPNKNT